MKSEYEYKTAEGKYIIDISLSISTWGHEENFRYIVGVRFVEKGKRKPIFVIEDNYPANLVNDAKLCFWNQIKPTK
jgi:hypothetical protein